MLEFGILGPLEVARDGRPLQLGGPKQRATLAILLLNADRVVSIDRLADDLYAGAPPVTAVTQVQRQISDLRKVLGEESPIETRSPGYLLRLAGAELDLVRFERMTDQANEALDRGAAREAADMLRTALALWRGEPLADLASEPFTGTAIRRLEELRLTAVERRIDAELELGLHRELVAEIEQLSADHPLREHLRAQLMVALYRSGRQSDALDVYRATRRTLVETFGIEPGQPLRDLEAAVLRQDASLDSVARVSTDVVRNVLVVCSEENALDALVAIGGAIARAFLSELIVARLVPDESELEAAASRLDGLDSPLSDRGLHDVRPAE